MPFDLESSLATLSQLATTWGVRVVGVVIALFVAWAVAGWAGRSLRKTLEQRNFDLTLTRFFSQMLRYAILVGAVLGCLGVFGIETASFAAVIAAAGLAVGLALQGTLGNFASGMMLLVFRPFKVGDFVRVADETGHVESIDLFTTELKTLDGRRLVVPNGQAFGNVIENFTHHPQRRVSIEVGTAYDADIDTTREALSKAIQGLEQVLEEPAPQIFLKAFGASSIDWEVRVWCETTVFWDVHQEVIAHVKRALDEAEINIPFPQMDVHVQDTQALRGRLSPAPLSSRPPSMGLRTSSIRASGQKTTSSKP